MKRSPILSILINLVVGLAVTILGLRVLFRLFAANPTAPFVHWVYVTSNTLLEPFRGIFPNEVINKSYVLDFTALFALVMYLIAGSLLLYVARLLEGPKSTLPKSSKRI
jgi:uncharacterized protein YggT (Ycf19 family)